MDQVIVMIDDKKPTDIIMGKPPTHVFRETRQAIWALDEMDVVDVLYLDYYLDDNFTGNEILFEIAFSEEMVKPDVIVLISSENDTNSQLEETLVTHLGHQYAKVLTTDEYVVMGLHALVYKKN